MCQTYLGDVLDHCITINEGYDQMRRSADNMIDLIFNTIGKLKHQPENVQPGLQALISSPQGLIRTKV